MEAFDRARVTAAVLAGGAGKRFGGRDKGLAPLRGKPLVAHVVAALTEQAAALLICVNRNDAAYAAFGATLRDGRPGFCGPLAGIATALAACRTEWLLTVPVDCPAPPRDLARRLYDAANDARAAAAVVNSGVRREPLFALYARALAPSADAALAQDQAVWRWQDAIGAVETLFEPAQDWANLNDAAEFRAWEARSND